MGQLVGGLAEFDISLGFYRFPSNVPEAFRGRGVECVEAVTTPCFELSQGDKECLESSDAYKIPARVHRTATACIVPLTLREKNEQNIYKNIRRGLSRSASASAFLRISLSSRARSASCSAPLYSLFMFSVFSFFFRQKSIIRLDWTRSEHFLSLLHCPFGSLCPPSAS